MYATNANSHACDPGDAAESLCMSLIVIKASKGSQGGITRRRASRLDLMSLAISDLPAACQGERCVDLQHSTRIE